MTRMSRQEYEEFLRWKESQMHGGMNRPPVGDRYGLGGGMPPPPPSGSYGYRDNTGPYVPRDTYNSYRREPYPPRDTYGYPSDRAGYVSPQTQSPMYDRRPPTPNPHNPYVGSSNPAYTDSSVPVIDVGAKPVQPTTQTPVKTQTKIDPLNPPKGLIPEPGSELPPLFDEEKEYLEILINQERKTYRYVIKTKNK